MALAIWVWRSVSVIVEKAVCRFKGVALCAASPVAGFEECARLLKEEKPLEKTQAGWQAVS